MTAIDSAGGVAKSADGLLMLEVPPGALATPTSITILTDRSSRNADLVRPIYELGPRGLIFRTPTVLSLSTEGLTGLALVNVDEPTPVIVEGYSEDPVRGVLRAPLAHFSRYSAMRPRSDGGSTLPDREAQEAGEPVLNCPSVSDGGTSLEAGAVGRVAVNQAPGNDGVSANGQFPWAAPWYPPPYGCTAHCVVRAGVLGDGGLAGDSSVGPSAGTISIAGGLGNPITMNHPNYSLYRAGRAYEGGEPLVVSATGADGGISAFAARLPGPTTVQATVPSGTVSRLRDLELGWSAPGRTLAGTMEVVLDGPTRRPNGWDRVHIVCEYPASDRTGRIPASVLQEVREGTAAISLTVQSSTIASSRSGLVVIRADNAALSQSLPLFDPDSGVPPRPDASVVGDAGPADGASPPDA